jgi:hypothetical protein
MEILLYLLMTSLVIGLIYLAYVLSRPISIEERKVSLSNVSEIDLYELIQKTLKSEDAIVVTYKQEPVGIFLNVKGFDNFPSEIQKLLSSISRCSCSQSSKD